MSYQFINENFYRCETCGPFGLQLALQYNPSTGDYRLIEKNLLGTGSAIFYQNGTYFSDAIRDPKLFTDGDPNKITQFAIDLSANIRSEVNKKYSGLGGRAKPGLKINDSAKKENIFGRPGVNNYAVGATPGPASILPPLSNPPGQGNIFDPGIKINATFGLPNARERNKDSKLLTYPEDILENLQDTFRITRYQYSAPYKDIFNGTADIGKILTQGLSRSSGLAETPIGTVILPMPNQVSDSNNTSWGDDYLNPLSTAATALVTKDLGGAATTQALTAAAEIGSLPGAANIPQLVLLGRLAAAGGLDNENVQAQLKAAAASFLLARAKITVSPESILARGNGVIPNSNLALIFNNVTLRQFGFSYKMSPRSEKEAANVRRIIRFFKEGMAAKKQQGIGGGGGGAAGAASLFLGTPDVFKLEYKSGNKSIKGVNKFKVCALQSFSVNYTAENQWESYDDDSAPGQPVSLIMQMQFKEIEPIYDTDYQASTLSDQPSIADSDDVGF
jgi:hypothetical protein